MIKRLNHVAIVVPDLATASATYRDTLGASVSAPQILEEHGVTVVFVDLANTRIELLEPLGDQSPVSNFLERHSGGMLGSGRHHGGARRIEKQRRSSVRGRRTQNRCARKSRVVSSSKRFSRLFN